MKKKEVPLKEELFLKTKIIFFVVISDELIKYNKYLQDLQDLQDLQGCFQGGIGNLENSKMAV